MNIYFEDLSQNLPACGYLRNGVWGSRCHARLAELDYLIPGQNCHLYREAGWNPSGPRLPAVLLYGLSVSRGAAVLLVLTGRGPNRSCSVTN